MPSFDFRKIIDTSLLQDLPDSFYEATGVTTAVHNADGELVTRIPHKNFSAFCSNMFYNKKGHARCLASNRAGAQRSVQKNGPYVHKCHAGLVDVFAPIMYNGKHVGTVCCGQLMFDKATDKKKEEVRRKLRGFPPHFIEKQISTLDDVTIVSKHRVEGLARLLGGISNEIIRLILAHQKEKASSEEKSRLLDEITTRSKLEEEIKNAQIRLKESELRLLEAQINPHFLYNTLDSIHWLAAKHGRTDIQEMIYSLSSLMRYSLGRGNHVISVGDEVEQIQNYLSIQKVRYGSKLDYHINLESEVRDYRIPKLVLQPLVENAIKHGIEPSKTPGTISISGWQTEEGNAVLEVENNGVPVSQAQISSMVSRLEQQDAPNRHVMERRPGYGLTNVHERLKLCLGKEHGLEIRRTEEGNVIMRIVVPKTLRAGQEPEDLKDADNSPDC